jgi:hypothetical protein
MSLHEVQRFSLKIKGPLRHVGESRVGQTILDNRLSKCPFFFLAPLAAEVRKNATLD